MTDKEFLKKLGKRIVELRKQKSLKQIDLAGILEMEDSSLRRIESGRVNSTIVMLRKISKALNVSIDELLKFK